LIVTLSISFDTECFFEEWRFRPTGRPFTRNAINADNWLYQLISYNESEFVDINLYLDAPIANETMFGELVVEALIGEERRLDQIGYISPNCVDTLPDNTTPIRFLNDHLDQVLASSQIEA